MGVKKEKEPKDSGALDELNAKLAAAQKELEWAQKNVTTLEAAAVQDKERLAEAHEKIDELKKRLEDIQARIRELEQRAE